MFKKIKTVPHLGTDKIHFGMSQFEVRNVLGTPFQIEEPSIGNIIEQMNFHLV